MTDLRTVSIADPAVDIDAMGAAFNAFLEKRDPALVAVVPGEKPTWFVIGDIDTAAFLSYVATAPTDVERFVRAFTLGVKLIENAPGGDGLTMTPGKTETVGAGAIRTRWTEEQMATIPPAYIMEIGSLAHTRSLLGKARVGSWPVPHSLGHVLVGRLRRSLPAAETDGTSED
jgi:hypothetical protein